MSSWRVVFALGLAVFVFVPLLTPFREIGSPAIWAWSQEDAIRLRHLAANSVELSAGTLALALPSGLFLAVLLFRTQFPGRRFCLFLLALALFVPLPVAVSCWQGAFGVNGWLPLTFLRSAEDRPWATGMAPAVLVHALASVPWAAFIIGIGLSWVEPELEEEGAQNVDAWRVLAWITLPRVRASILAAALFVVLQTAGEISVTDMMLVGTLAEEAYAQFATDRAGLARTLALSLPALIVVWGAVLLAVAYLERSLPPLAPSSLGTRGLELASRWLRLTAVTVVLLVLLMPLFSVVWKLGLVGMPGHWSFDACVRYLKAESSLLGRSLFMTIVVSLGTGGMVAVLALAACWLARESAWFRWLLFSAATLAWVIPGPVVGIGLHEIIVWLPDGPWKDALYYGPSPLPLMWVQAIRALPIAVVFLWPIVRMIPREVAEEARLAGGGELGAWLGVVLPLAWRATGVVALASAALCLGEVAASTRVETPGWESFTKLIFDRMHYGVDNNVSALCVLMLATLGVIGIVVFGFVILTPMTRRGRG